MTPIERDFRRLASFHDDMVSEGGWLSIDLTRPPALGRHKEDWSDYIGTLLALVQKAAHGRGGLKLDYGRFLRLRSRKGP